MQSLLHKADSPCNHTVCIAFEAVWRLSDQRELDPQKMGDIHKQCCTKGLARLARRSATDEVANLRINFLAPASPREDAVMACTLCGKLFFSGLWNTFAQIQGRMGLSAA